jgi:hypothetical protein
MELDTNKIDNAVLALLYLGLHDRARAWKGFDWEAMNRLHNQRYITDPRGKAKSVVFTEEGLERARRLLEEMFTKRAEPTAPAAELRLKLFRYPGLLGQVDGIGDGTLHSETSSYEAMRDDRSSTSCRAPPGAPGSAIGPWKGARADRPRACIGVGPGKRQEHRHCAKRLVGMYLAGSRD